MSIAQGRVFDINSSRSNPINACLKVSHYEDVSILRIKFADGILECVNSSSFLCSTAQLKPWPPPQNPAEFLGGFSTIFFFTG
jgi:hypothetical protein